MADGGMVGNNDDRPAMEMVTWMNEGKNSAIIALIVAVLAAIPDWVGLIEDYGPIVLGRLYPIAVAMYPVILVSLGFLAGWNAKRWRTAKSRRGAAGSDRDESAEQKATISSLRTELAAARAENLVLLSQLSNAELDSSQSARAASGKLNANMAAIEVMSPEMARAILAVYRGENAYIPYGEHKLIVEKSIKRGDWVFKPGYYVFNGCPTKPTDTFTLHQDWLKFVGDERVLKRLNERASECSPLGVPVVEF